MTHWESRLRAAGGRITPQRRLIAAILQEQDRPLSADEIYLLARRQYSSLSLATVYRTLQWLKEARLVRELRLNGACCRYALERGEAYQHIVCLICGKVIELTCAHCAAAYSDLADQHGFQITGAQIRLSGYCAECQAHTH